MGRAEPDGAPAEARGEPPRRRVRDALTVPAESVGIDTESADAPALIVGGADLLDGTPIYDIKPYIPAFDCHTDAVGGFADEAPERKLRVAAPDGSLDAVPAEKRQALIDALSFDPRPSYQDDPERVYGFSFAGCEVRFRVEDGVLTVISSERRDQASQ